MNNTLKIRSYAVFQFISFFAIIALLIAAVLIGYTVIFDDGNANQSLAHGATWSKYIIGVLRWEHLEAIGTFASIMTYVSMITFLASWTSGWMIFRVKNRNLFDSLFLLFLCLPIISNIFALFAQVATKEITLASSKIDKKAVVIEQTKVLNMEHRKELRKQAALNRKRKAAQAAKEAAAKETAAKAAEVEAQRVKKLEEQDKQKQAAIKQAAAKKSVAKKSVNKKPAAKKAVAKKAPAKKPVAKKPVTKKAKTKK